jgi:hypothetical protein
MALLKGGAWISTGCGLAQLLGCDMAQLRMGCGSIRVQCGSVQGAVWFSRVRCGSERVWRGSVQGGVAQFRVRGGSVQVAVWFS